MEKDKVASSSKHESTMTSVPSIDMPCGRVDMDVIPGTDSADDNHNAGIPDRGDKVVDGGKVDGQASASASGQVSAGVQVSVSSQEANRGRQSKGKCPKNVPPSSRRITKRDELENLIKLIERNIIHGHIGLEKIENLLQTIRRCKGDLNKEKILLLYATESPFLSPEVVRMFVDLGSSVNDRDDQGRTILNWTIILDVGGIDDDDIITDDASKLELINFLIEKGADVTLTDDDGNDPLKLSLISGQPEFIITRFIDVIKDLSGSENSECKNPECKNPECKNSESKKSENVINRKNEAGFTSLHLMLLTETNGNVGLLNSLLSAGADPNVTDHVNGNNSLHWLFHSYPYPANNSKYTQEARTQVHERYNFKKYPILFYSAAGPRQCFDLLIEAGVDIDAVNKHGKVPFELALTSPGPLNLHILSELIPRRMELIESMNEGSLSILKMVVKKDMRSIHVKEFEEFFYKLISVGCSLSQPGLLCDAIHNFKFKYEMIQVFLQNGIPVTVEDMKDAVEMRRLDVAHSLLIHILDDHSCKTLLQNQYPDILLRVIGPFEWGAFHDDLALQPLTLVKLLLEHFSIDVNHTNHRDKFILHNLIREYPSDTIPILNYLIQNYPHLDLNKKIFIPTGFQPPWTDSDSNEGFHSNHSDSASNGYEKGDDDKEGLEKRDNEKDGLKDRDDKDGLKHRDDEEEEDTSKDHDKKDGNYLGMRKENDGNTLGAKWECDGKNSSTSIDVGSNQERMECIKLPSAVVSSCDASNMKVSGCEVSNVKVSSCEALNMKVLSCGVSKAGTSEEERRSPLLGKIPVLYVNEEGDKVSNTRPLCRKYLKTALELALENGRYEFAAILIRNFASVDGLKVPAPSMVGFTECYQLLYQLGVPLEFENSLLSRATKKELDWFMEWIDRDKLNVKSLAKLSSLVIRRNVITKSEIEQITNRFLLPDSVQNMLTLNDPQDRYVPENDPSDRWFDSDSEDDYETDYEDDDSHYGFDDDDDDDDYYGNHFHNLYLGYDGYEQHDYEDDDWNFGHEHVSDDDHWDLADDHLSDNDDDNYPPVHVNPGIGNEPEVVNEHEVGNGHEVGNEWNDDIDEWGDGGHDDWNDDVDDWE